VRAFNDTVQEVFALAPTELRARAARRHQPATSGSLMLRLPFRTPLCPDNLFGHLTATAVPGVEEWLDGAYRRTLRLPHGYGVAALRPLPDHIDCRLALTDLRDLSTAITRCRWLLDLDADPVAVDELLRSDLTLAPLVDKNPGRRVPRTVDALEFAVRAVLGQQVSTQAARTHAGRLVAAYGDPVSDPAGGLTHLFPDPAALAALDPAALALPQARRTTLTTLVGALATGEIDLSPASDWQQARVQLARLPGLGPWTIEMVAMRALGDPDAFVAADLGVRRAARDMGLPVSASALTRHATAWRPWRAYAVQYLWSSSNHAINRLPA
jgi:AraC family transcriptional regulator of adaptative response / DNA-3-methyladenine glycosylase II